MTTYHLRHAPAASSTPVHLDTSQRAVVAHRGGPLLVLAGPGTGKTTTMVEAIVDLVERRGVAPDEILALTFSRKAAEQLRDRVTARLGRTLATTVSSTFHSFAFSLVRHFTDKDAYAAPLRLLSAPQQDAVLRDLLRPTPEAVEWPSSLADAVRTRGFSRELETLLNRARERGIGGERLTKLGAEHGRPEWEAAGRFLEDYLTILDAQSALDYADLVVRAVRLARDPLVQAELRGRYRWVFVDEYQDTDPAQVALLQALAGDGRNLVVVGDPDQSIYGFRGAEVRGILDFPEDFRTTAGEPAPVVALQTTRRFGPGLLAASRRIATSIPVHGAIPLEAFAAFREPVPVEGGHGPGDLEVLHFDTARAEVEHIADQLRRAHLEDGLPWSEMAVLVRSGRSSIPQLRRALTVAGVPVEVAADDTPLMAEPAVQPLLDGLQVALHLGTADPQHPHYVDADKADALLRSPLGAMDAAELRALARGLLRVEKAAAAVEERRPRSSRELVREAVFDPDVLGALEPGRAVDKARNVARLLRRVHSLAGLRASAEELLWVLWSGTRWPERLRATALSGGPGSAAAHRDLDAVCALFEEAAKAEEQRGHTSAESFLETLRAQELPADTLADRGVRGDAVRLLTAHRSKGLEWMFVVVASVQEGVWPDLRRRSTLLRADELPKSPSTPETELLPPVGPRVLLAEERRLFYVACTRARRRLLVTAVASPDDDGEQPSRFTEELGVEPRRVVGRPERPLSLAGLVADLRRTASDPQAPQPLREAAVRRLARLSLARHEGVPLAPAADPATWWGIRSRSQAERPIRAADEPLRLSASALDAMLTCPTKWFLDREAAGSPGSTAAQGFGKIVHTLADRVVKGDAPPDATDEELMDHVDRVWSLMSFRTPWAEVRERAEVQTALRKFLEWHRRPEARTVLGTETELRAEVEVDGEVVRLHGFADRLELDADGRVVVVDLKTTKQHPSRDEVAEHAQLGLYQLAVESGAVDELVGRPAVPGGAELVQLRNDNLGAKVQRQEPQQPDSAGRRPIEVQLSEAVRRIRDEEFPARVGPHCRHCPFTALCPHETSGTVLS